MPFDYHLAHRPLVDAAIRFGDWLLTLNPTTVERAVIRAMQGALGRLPSETPNLDAAYAFEIREGAVGDGPRLFRSWNVAYYPLGTIEIFSIYTPFPRPTDIFEEVDREMSLYWEANTPQSPTPEYWARWIREVEELPAYDLNGVQWKLDIS